MKFRAVLKCIEVYDIEIEADSMEQATRMAEGMDDEVLDTCLCVGPGDTDWELVSVSREVECESP